MESGRAPPGTEHTSYRIRLHRKYILDSMQPIRDAVRLCGLGAKGMRHLYFLLFALWIGSAGTVGAQSLFGTVLGRVTDPSGAKIPGAVVTIRNVNTNLARS